MLCVSGARLRKISGNVSDNSSCSLKEIRYARGGEDDRSADERIVYVSSEKKVPFAIFSVIPFHKSGGARAAAR